MNPDPPAAERPSIAAIKAAVCASFGVTMLEMISMRRPKHLALARHTAFWLARAAGYSFPAIGRAFGDRDHTTVMHGVSRVERLLAADPDYAAAVDKLSAAVGCIAGDPWQQPYQEENRRYG